MSERDLLIKTDLREFEWWFKARFTTLLIVPRAKSWRVVVGGACGAAAAATHRRQQRAREHRHVLHDVQHDQERIAGSGLIHPVHKARRRIQPTRELA
jgi:hypothetical protein